MELRDRSLAQSLYPGFLDNADDRMRTLNHASDQAESHIDTDILSNAARLLGATEGREDSATSIYSTTNFMQGVSYHDDLVTDGSPLDSPTQSPFPSEQTAQCGSSSSTLSTSSNERSQSSILSSESEAAWPDRVEEAFQKAWRLCPLQGRQRIRSNGRNITKNQWISAFIRKETGAYRTRKQVSSHIQTLMTNGTKDPAQRVPVAPMIGLNKDTQSENNVPISREVATPTGRTRTDDPSSDQNTFAVPLIDTDTLLPQETNIVGATPRFPQMQRVKFSMFLLNEVGRTVHVFTSIQKEPEPPPIKAVDISDVSMKYPPLAEHHEKGWISNPVFSFEAYLNVADDIPIHNSLLALEFTIEFAAQTFFDHWQCSTRIYESGNEVDLSEASYLSRPGDGRWEYPECVERFQTNTAKLAIPLKSKWWSHTLMKIVSERREVEKSADPELINREDEKIRHYIESLSVVQEIWAAPRGTDLLRQRVVTFLWNFKQTQRANTATTSWRSVQPQTSLSQRIQPLPSQYQNLRNTEVALGAAIHPSSIPAGLDLADNLANTAEFLPGNSQALEYPDVFSSNPSTSDLDCVTNGAPTSHPPPESLLQNHHSGALFSAPLDSWQPQESFMSQGSNFNDSWDVPWSAFNPFDADLFSPPLEPWQLQQSFIPQGSNSCSSHDTPSSASNSNNIIFEAITPRDGSSAMDDQNLSQVDSGAMTMPPASDSILL